MLTLLPQEDSLNPYLRATEVIDLDAPSVRAVHADIVRGSLGLEDEARRVFVFVRDQIRHSWDAAITR